MFRKSFRPQLEQLGERCLPSANPTITISDVAVVEGQDGQTAMVFTVTLSKAARKEVTVDFAIADGTATALDNDYIPTSGKLKFARGQTTQTITVLVNGDAAFEPDEYFLVNLTNARYAALVDAQGVGSILNDDAGDGGGGDGCGDGAVCGDGICSPWESDYCATEECWCSVDCGRI